MDSFKLTHSMHQKIAAQKWVQARVEIGGKLVSVIGTEWFDKVDVTLSSRPLSEYNGEWEFTAYDQAERYLKSLKFGPYQNTGEPDFEAAVEPATEKLTALIPRFKEHYINAVKAGKTHFVFCEDFDEFSIIITVREG